MDPSDSSFISRRPAANRNETVEFTADLTMTRLYSRFNHKACVNNNFMILKITLAMRYLRGSCMYLLLNAFLLLLLHYIICSLCEQTYKTKTMNSFPFGHHMVILQ